MEGLDGRHTEGADVRVGLEGAVGPGRGRPESGGPEEIRGRGGGGGEAPEIGGAGAPAAAGSTAEAVRPHQYSLCPHHLDRPPASRPIPREPPPPLGIIRCF